MSTVTKNKKTEVTSKLRIRVRAHDSRLLDNSVKQIIEKVKAEGVNNSPSVLNDLENKLRTDVALRGE
jgi:ribosomal protein S10